MDVSARSVSRNQVDQTDSRRNIGRTTNGSERAGGLVVRPKRAPLTPSKDDWDDRPGHASCQSWCELCVRVMQGCSIMDVKNAFATKLRSSEVVLVKSRVDEILDQEERRARDERCAWRVRDTTAEPGGVSAAACGHAEHIAYAEWDRRMTHARMSRTSVSVVHPPVRRKWTSQSQSRRSLESNLSVG